ncbi:MAG: hypothetical protein AB7E76_06850 [Deferribacterales bacterium]
MHKAKLSFILFFLLPVIAYAGAYDLSELKFRYFRNLFPPANHMLPSTADYKFNGEWVRRKGNTREDYNIKVKTYVYQSNTHHLVFVKFKRHGMPFCWWFSKDTEGRPPKGWIEGACDVDNDGIYESVWDMNGCDTIKYKFCDYWNCDSY